MKVLFLTRRFYPDVGGVEKHVHELSKRLIAQKHTVALITETPGTSPEIIDGITVYRLGVTHESWVKKFILWKKLFSYYSVFKSADIIHCHDVFFWYLPFRFLFWSKKVYITFHGYEGYPLRKGAVLMHKIGEMLTKGNICIGNFYKKWYGTTPTLVSFGAVEKPKKENQVTKKLSSYFVGRLDAQTNILEYAQAMTKIQKIYPSFTFTIIGDGAYTKRLSKFKPRGFVDPYWKHVSNTHFAFVSRYLAILEAMIQKRLVFAFYDNPIKKDYLELTPFVKDIVITHSIDELVKQVMYYLSHPEEEKKLKEQAYSWAKNQTWENLTKTYLTLWNV